MSKLFAILIALLVIMTPQTVFATDTQQESRLIAFGDSITNGYGVGQDNSYANMFAREKNYCITNYAVDGLTSGGLLSKIGTVDQQEISNADLILVCIGANDILSLLTAQGIPTSVVALNEFANVLNSQQFKNTLQVAVSNFETNFVAIINLLKELNTNIHTATVFNPYSGIVFDNTLMGIDRFNLGLYAEEWIGKINNVIENNAINPVADVFAEFENYSAEQKILNVEADFNTMQFNFDPHPTIAGQQLISKCFVDSMRVHNSEILPDQPVTWLYIAIAVVALIGITIIVIIAIKKRNPAKN